MDPKKRSIGLNSGLYGGSVILKPGSYLIKKEAKPLTWALQLS